MNEKSVNRNSILSCNINIIKVNHNLEVCHLTQTETLELKKTLKTLGLQ